IEYKDEQGNVHTFEKGEFMTGRYDDGDALGIPMAPEKLYMEWGMRKRLGARTFGPKGEIVKYVPTNKVLMELILWAGAPTVEELEKIEKADDKLYEKNRKLRIKNGLEKEFKL